MGKIEKCKYCGNKELVEILTVLSIERWVVTIYQCERCLRVQTNKFEKR